VVKHIGTYFSAHSIKNLSFSFVVAKVDIFFDSTNFLQIFCEILFDFKKNALPLHSQNRNGM